jgi:hypothetical protein
LTSILALRKEIGGVVHTVYGADSLVVRNNEKVILSNNHKFVEYPTFAVLYSGACSVLPVLEEFRDDPNLKKRKFMKMQTKLDIQDLSVNIKRRLRKRIEDLDGAEATTAAEFELLFVTKFGIYHQDFDFLVESDKFLVSGSGSQYMLPLLLQGYYKVETLEDLKILAYQAIEISIKLSTQVDYPIIVKELT